MAVEESGAASAQEPVLDGERPAAAAARRKVPASKRIRQTPGGPVRLTPTEMLIISFLQRHEGYPCSKSQIAAAIGRNEKTVDRLLSRLRHHELVTSEAAYAESGAQLPNIYRLTKWAKTDARSSVWAGEKS
ncbi:helix-turn-helix domain-containing protein [Olsenella profusa]|uniref:MarR family transcriptional regulator n=1 Tax=Olsenella profusa TaxID=138595 RepID=A0ABS2F3V2_9ACTN|nr:helix-turn-helix domain-containing protein [Olsenella profusa]MBM6775233.1 hypothetical protein [Olsenella profusa]